MEQIESRLNDMSIINADGVQPLETKWGWSLTDLYRNALNFYKGTYEKKEKCQFLMQMVFFLPAQKKPEKQSNSRTKII